VTARKRTIEYAKPFCVGDLTKRKRARIGLQLVSPQVRGLTTLFFSGHSVLDPAAGAGAFLVPAVKRMLKALGPCSPAFAVQILATPIREFELDPFEAYLGQVFIEAAALPIIADAGQRLDCQTLKAVQQRGPGCWIT
jgi:hypothetical protein